MGQDDLFYMDKSNNILNGINPCSKIYRILPLHRFLELIKKRKTYLINIAKYWEDPYENFLYSIDATKYGYPLSLDSLKNTVFGQSWSLLKESDAMWRIYSQNNMGVKIKVSVANLINQLWKDGRDTRLSLFFGEVRYVSEEKMNTYLTPSKVDRALFKSNDNIKTAEYALLKRMQFKHEKEVRLLYFTDSGSPYVQQDFIEFAVDPDILIEEAVLDPRLTDLEYRTLKYGIQQSGFTGAIRKSTLYGSPKFHVTL